MDLRSAGCEIVTIGQYLQPSPRHLGVKEFINPETFEELRRTSFEIGFKHAGCGPFVRSSYNAREENICGQFVEPVKQAINQVVRRRVLSQIK